MDPAGESDLANKCIYCRGVDANSQPCDCEEFFSESQDKAHYVVCGHGCSKHSRKVSGYTPESVQDKPRPSSLAIVKKIMDRIIGASVNDKPSTTKSPFDVVFYLDCQLQQVGCSIGWLAQVSQTCQSTSSSNTTAMTTVFQVGSIAMPTCGVNMSQRNGFLRETKAPGKGGQNEVQAIIEELIDTRWTYSMIMRNLHTWFPKVFKHLDGQVEKRVSQSHSTQEDKPIWRLLNKTGLLLTVVDVAFQTGHDLGKHKGRDKASVNECHLWFGSDSEHDCSDQLLSDTNSSVNDKSDNDLASSLMELDLTNDKVKHSDSKGKMKARLSRRTNHMKRALSPDESPPDARRVVQNKLKKETASDTSIPLFFMDPGSSSSQAPPSTQPTQSSTLLPASVLQLKDELSLHPFAPEHINPWDSPAAFLT
ncbi:hypothetical protein EV702DRAFT_1051763 [Suillus placidus]|uniref:Uncharacterized protein n=1 Tax=Suillus placidus TaxID=48579 RepID=A0A9P6ZG93_9AGAM|nr:hypothetical protein EV702DRAFT_1051763 [Suillus placidus]